MSRSSSLLVLLVVVGCSHAVASAGAGEARASAPADQPSRRPMTDAVMASVEQAIEDELYDYRREKLYFEVDGDGGGDRTPAKISVHVSKSLSSDGAGAAVYVVMPLGRVYRYFTVDESGLVRLSGNLEIISRNTGGSFQTIYMRADELAKFIMSRSVRGTFTIDPNASAERIQAAIERQLQRTGYSFRKDRRK